MKSEKETKKKPKKGPVKVKLTKKKTKPGDASLGKDVLEGIKDEKEEEKEIPENQFDLVSWQPKTGIGKKVKSGEITDIDTILSEGKNILEESIVEALVPNLKSELLMVGQSKGKFGGGSRRVFKQTQKKTREGNKPQFLTFAAVGNSDGIIGIGSGKSRETVPAREKAIRQAKLNVFKIKRGCGSWQCGCKEPHSIPLEVDGKVGSVVIKLIPAPKGTGLIAESEIAKILDLAGIKDVWSKTSGHTEVRTNLVKAAVKALQRLSDIKINQKISENLGVIDGKIKTKEQ